MPETIYIPNPLGLESGSRGLGCCAGSSGGGGSVGVGSPEGVVIGNPGNSYLDSSTNSFWFKETGTGTNVGWIQLIA